MVASALYTFGYEGLTIEAFIERLKQARVQLIVDVRELPLSRKRGFSKTAFREALAVVGIAYEHRSALGCPKPVRDRYKVDADWQAYIRGFQAHLVTQQAEIEKLARTMLAQTACLVCFEADPAMCHRSYIAEALTEFAPIDVMHLTTKGLTVAQR